MHILILSIGLLFGQISFADLVGEGTIDHTIIEQFDEDTVTLVLDDADTFTAGLFTIEFEVTPIGSDLFLRDLALHNTSGIPGVSFAIHDLNGVISNHNGLMAAALSSHGTVLQSLARNFEQDVYFELEEGEFSEFALIVVYQPAITGLYKLVLQSATFFNEDGGMVTIDVTGDSIDTEYLHLVGDPSLATVPLPAGIWLMLSGLMPLLWKRRST